MGLFDAAAAAKVGPQRPVYPTARGVRKKNRQYQEQGFSVGAIAIFALGKGRIQGNRQTLCAGGNACSGEEAPLEYWAQQNWRLLQHPAPASSILFCQICGDKPRQQDWLHAHTFKAIQHLRPVDLYDGHPAEILSGPRKPRANPLMTTHGPRRP